MHRFRMEKFVSFFPMRRKNGALGAYKAHYAGQSRYERMVEMYAKQLEEMRK